MRVLLVGASLIILGGCGLPTPECDANPNIENAEQLPCAVAVEAALDALPPDHPEIARIQFLYGSATPCCSYIYPQDEDPPVQGFVVFTYAREQEYVPVWWWRGELTVGDPAPR